MKTVRQSRHPGKDRENKYGGDEHSFAAYAIRERAKEKRGNRPRDGQHRSQRTDLRMAEVEFRSEIGRKIEG